MVRPAFLSCASGCSMRCSREGDALAPVGLANPVADFRFPELFIFIAQDTASHMPVEEDGLYGDGLVSQNLGPVHHEGIPVRWVLGRESRHLVRVRVQLLVEEDR